MHFVSDTFGFGQYSSGAGRSALLIFEGLWPLGKTLCYLSRDVGVVTYIHNESYRLFFCIRGFQGILKMIDQNLERRNRSIVNNVLVPLFFF